ncbi:hypothetical protein ACWDWU_05845 [Streptomyces sp. NPDC003442]
MTGRIEDVIVVDWTSHYPQDVEYTAEHSHPAVRGGCVAAFGIEEDGRERLVIVAELDHAFDGDTDAVAAAVRGAVSEEHWIDVHEVVFIAVRTVPKTSSGKIRRGESRGRYLGGTLDVRYAPAEPGRATATGARRGAFVRLTRPPGTRWLPEWVPGGCPGTCGTSLGPG